jgi:AraC-like DNA-binding protein
MQSFQFVKGVRVPSTCQQMGVGIKRSAAKAVQPENTMTRTVEPQKTMTDGTAPGVGDRDAIPSDRYFTDHPVESRGTTVLRHYRFHTRDPEAARRFLEDAYKPGWRIDGLAPEAAVTQRRCDTGLITVDEVRIEGRASCDIRATDRVVVIRPLAGSMTVDSEPPERLDDPLLVADGLPCVLQTNAVRLAVVCIDVNLLRNVARKRNAPLPQQIEFLSSRPQSPSAVRAWDQAAEYVGATFACEKTAQRPLIVAAVAELLVAATLECFPSNLTGGEELLHDAGRPAAFKGAVSFIDQHAGPGIGINDVAAAVGLTPRAVQYLFRQQLNTTPTEYLRRVRLHRAHRDLVDSSRSEATVGEIAQRWGFAHTGRFALLYRQAFGESPHHTLKH